MSTTSTIGTASRNYSTITAWNAAWATGGWIGQCYNDSEFSTATETIPITFSQATTSTDFITLQTGHGQGFKDNANAKTNALAYNVSNGVGVKGVSGNSQFFAMNVKFTTIQYLQFFWNTTADRGLINTANLTGANLPLIDSCIFQLNIGGGTDFGAAMLQMDGGDCQNCVFIRQSSGGSGDGVGFNYQVATLENCTFVRASDLASHGVAVTSPGGAAQTNTIKNCAFFNFATIKSGGVTLAGSNNCSDLTVGFGSSNQNGKTYANQFVTTTITGADYRLKSGADCVDNGTSSGTPTTDIIGTIRPQGSAYDIGAWELAAAAGLIPPGAQFMPFFTR